MRQTKIVATFGPSLEDPKILKKVLERVDVIRFNLAHGTWDKADDQNNSKKIKLVQKTAKEIKKPIAILVDLKGNKIRIGNFKKHLIDLKDSEEIDVRFTDQTITNKHEIIINANHVFEKINKKDMILMDDGLIKLRVSDITPTKKTLHCQVIEGGLLRSNKGFEVENKIINGIRLSGKLNDNLRIGLLNVLTEENKSLGIPQNNNTLFTIRNKVFARSNYSFFFINRENTKDYDFLGSLVNIVSDFLTL